MIFGLFLSPGQFFIATRFKSSAGDTLKGIVGAIFFLANQPRPPPPGNLDRVSSGQIATQAGRFQGGAVCGAPICAVPPVDVGRVLLKVAV
jgi:hypothetical protein